MANKIYAPLVPGAEDGYVADAANMKGGMRSIGGNGPPTIAPTKLVSGMIVTTQGDNITWLWDGSVWSQAPLLRLPANPERLSALIQRQDGTLLLAPITQDMFSSAFLLSSIAPIGFTSVRELGNDLSPGGGRGFSISRNRSPFSAYGVGGPVSPFAQMDDGVNKDPIPGPNYNHFTLARGYTAPISLPAFVQWTASLGDAAGGPSLAQGASFSMVWALNIFSGNVAASATFTPNATLFQDGFESGSADPLWQFAHAPGVPPNTPSAVVGNYLDFNFFNVSFFPPNAGSSFQLFIGQTTAPWSDGQPSTTVAYSGNETASIDIDLTSVLDPGAAVTFWMQGGGSDTIQFDQFKVIVTNHDTGVPDVLVNTYVNDGVYRKTVLDISPYIGHVITIQWVNHDDGAGGDPYAVFIDDVSVQTGSWASTPLTFDEAFIHALQASSLCGTTNVYNQFLPAQSGTSTFIALPADFDPTPGFGLAFYHTIGPTQTFQTMDPVASNIQVTNGFGRTNGYNIYQSQATNLASGTWQIQSF
jgi:hypothetical protein